MNNNNNNNNNIVDIISQFKSNPMQMLLQKYNIPQGMSNPQEIIQHLLNSGQISQAQVNQAMKMRNNPIFGMFK